MSHHQRMDRVSEIETSLRVLVVAIEELRHLCFLRLSELCCTGTWVRLQEKINVQGRMKPSDEFPDN
jgi:hypothetical protein